MGDEIERLVTVFDANFSKLDEKLNKVIKSHYDAVDKIDKKWGGALSHADPGKALERVFSRARLGLIEEGGAKIGIFGSAIEELGPAGLAGAAAIAALALAFERAHAAAEWADSIEKAADKIGVTTTAIQEFDHVASVADIPIDVFREALTKANSVLGAFQSNVGDARAKKAFAALGITKEQARSFDNISQALPLITEKISQLGSAAEKTKIADALGLGPLLPVILKGRDNFAELTAEAHKYGLIISEDVIHRSAEAADKMKLAAEIADKSLKSVFIDLAPTVANLAMELAGLVRQLSEIVEKVPLAVAGLQKLLHLDPKNLPKIPGVDDLARAGILGPAGQTAANIGPLVGPIFDKLVSEGRAAKLQGGIKDLLAGKPVDLTGVSLEPKATGHATGLVDDKDALAAARQAEERARRGDKAIAEAKAAELRSQLDLTDDLDERLNLQTQILGIEEDQKAKDLAHQVRLKDIDAAAAKQVTQINRSTVSAKQEADTRDKRNEAAKRDLDFIGELQGFDDRIASAQGEMARTAVERRDIEVQALKSRQLYEREVYAQLLDVQVERKRITPDQRTELLTGRDRADRSEVAAARDRAATPLEQWRKENIQTAAQVEEAYQKVAVNGLNAITDGLTDAITGAKSLGAVFKDIANSIIHDLIRIAVQRSIVGPLANLLFPAKGLASGVVELGSVGHNAAGTSAWRGGLTEVGELGPELVNLPRGAQVIPNSQLRGLGSLSVPSMPTVVQQTVQFDNRGAIIWEDAQVRLQQYADTAAVRAATLGYKGSRRDIPAAMNRQAANALGGRR